MLRLLLLVIALILYGSLYPWHFNFNRYPGDPLDFLLHAWSWRFDRFVARGIAANILFYVPLGAAAFLTFVRRRSRLFAVLAAIPIGAVLSATVEILQLYVPGRDCGLLDVFSNTTGAALGALTALAWRRELQQKWARSAPFLAFPPLLLLACWLGHQLYPFVPSLHPKLLLENLSRMLKDAGFSSVQVWLGTAEWLAAAMALEKLLPHRRAAWRWLAVLMLVLPLRAFMVRRTLPLEAVLGAAAAWLLWCLLPAAWRRPAAALALASAVLLSELAPFHFAPIAARFSWIPFAASMEANRQNGLIVLFRKAFDYGAVVWLLHLGRLPYARAAALAAALLALCEGAQRYLPGRTPDITDPLLALLMAFVLWRLEAGPPFSPAARTAKND